ncbi:YihY/virulence factor BrkB family protein [soil metagenome]
MNNEPIIYSASIAFFTIFSLPAILIVITLIGSAVFSEEDVQNQIISRVESLVHEDAAEQVGVVLENVVEVPGGFWGILIGIVVVVKSATMIFFIMQKALNSIWRVKVKKNVKYLRLMKHRLINLAMVVGLGLLLFLSIVLDTVLVVFSQQFNDIFEGTFSPVIWIISLLFSLGVILIFFTSVLKVLPDVNISWKDALAGGLITAILFLIGKQIINIVLTNIEIAGVYAAAGSLVLILLWVFYSSIILFIGAEVTKAYANNHGREINPSSIAVKLEDLKH